MKEEGSHRKETFMDTPPPRPLGASKRKIIRTRIWGIDLLNNPRLNKGTAFTEEERDAFCLHGLLPPQMGSLEYQCERRKRVFDKISSPFSRYNFMRGLQDSTETLFYALIQHHIEEMLPVVYTPAVGEGCQRFSEVWRKPRGLFLSYPNKDRIERILADRRLEDVRCIVVSDGERILGLGDQGAGGMGIPIGKMALYTALGGIPPEHCLPVLLDLGTDNQTLLNDPIYVGWQHPRVRGQEYDDFIEAFVSAVERRWPRILLQWEDFAGVNAARLLERYRNRLCTFNDDIQGTAAVMVGTLLAAVNATGIPLEEHKIVMFGSGSAGIGIVEMLVAAMQKAGLSRQQALAQFYCFNSNGLMVEGGEGIRPRQSHLARKPEEVAGWELSASGSGQINLFDVVRNAKPTVLVGASMQPGAFTEEIVREMARNTPRPVILPLSNPTSKCEATAGDLLRWTEGRALVGTGSPFAPVEIGGRTIRISQVNNSFIFPGLALGTLVSHSSRVTDAMFMAAAQALASLSPARTDPNAPLLPPIADSRSVSLVVAEAVGRQAIAEGLSPLPNADDLYQRIRDYIWEPVYLPYKRNMMTWIEDEEED
jgi:malate dehydrogenase (oxaloacetate-decarboxylating)